MKTVWAPAHKGSNPFPSATEGHNLNVVATLLIGATMSIFSDFKKELGYRNVVNQYIELSQRSMQDEIKDKLSETFSLQDYAKQYGLNICELHDELSVRIAQNYIVNIHTSFELFLERFVALTASPISNNEKWDLDFILKRIYKGKIPSDVKILYYICDFYRHVRNNIMHSTSDEKTVAYKAAKTALERCKSSAEFIDLLKKLDAPHEAEFLTFDDQVFYSKSAVKLAEHIYHDTIYNLTAHTEKNHAELVAMTSKYHNNPSRMRAILNEYFAHLYPIKVEEYSVQITEIEKLLMS